MVRVLFLSGCTDMAWTRCINKGTKRIKPARPDHWRRKALRVIFIKTRMLLPIGFKRQQISGQMAGSSSLMSRSKIILN